MLLFSCLWFEDHDSPGYWDGVAVLNSKASKKTLPYMCTSYGEDAQSATYTVLDPRTLKHKE